MQELKKYMKGKVFIVSTPIGNLGDISYRAIETLKNVNYIYCEDTRTSKKLLDHYEIKTNLISLHMFNEKSRIKEIKKHLENEQNIAIISDAGTPLISDPGQIIINELKTKYNAEIISIPGANAILTSLTSSGLLFDNFAFLGFAPKEISKLKIIINKSKDIDTIIFYESPNRIKKTLENIEILFGDINVVIARELTKKFEEIINNKISLIKDSITEKGEFVLLIDNKQIRNIIDENDVKEKIELINNSKNTKKTISGIIENETIKKNEIYKLLK